MYLLSHCILLLAAQCDPLPTLENGMITYAPDMDPDYDNGTVATHSCNAGYRLDGAMT